MSREAPPNWTVVPLGTLASRIKKGTTPTTHGFAYEQTGVRFVKAESLVQGRIAPALCSYVSEKAHEFFQRSQLEDGDVLFTIAGTLGRIAIVTHADLPANTNQAVAIIRLAEPAQAPFVAYCLEHVAASAVNANGRGTGLQNMNLQQLGNLEVLLPPLAEQRRIAEILSSVDEAIQTTQAVIEQTRRAKELALEAMITSAEQHTSCGESTIGELAEFVTSGSRGWSRYYSDHGDAFIRIGNLTRESIFMDLDDIQRVKLPRGSTEGSRTRLQCGDVLVSITADLGIVGYMDRSDLGDAYVNQHIAMIRPRHDVIHSGYLACFLSGRKAQLRIQTLNDAGAKAGLKLPTIRNFRISVPSPAEQTRIFEAIAAIDGAIFRNSDVAARLKLHKAALMSDLLTGRKRVTSDLPLAAE